MSFSLKSAGLTLVSPIDLPFVGMASPGYSSGSTAGSSSGDLGRVIRLSCGSCALLCSAGLPSCCGAIARTGEGGSFVSRGVPCRVVGTSRRLRLLRVPTSGAGDGFPRRALLTTARGYCSALWGGRCEGRAGADLRLAAWHLLRAWQVHWIENLKSSLTTTYAVPRASPLLGVTVSGPSRCASACAFRPSHHPQFLRNRFVVTADPLTRRRFVLLRLVYCKPFCTHLHNYLKINFYLDVF